MGDCLIGEVSSFNNDVADNCIFEPAASFPNIEEAENPYRLLVKDYLAKA